ncbi:uncharacterized protein V1516DRAFT_668333 [Lipomyces oligophaga]|uniref:uncharacterized protein n=1 Tax=Lipomyces oligophaga TaxID=45792 RepID=UPI0034CF4B16
MSTWNSTGTPSPASAPSNGTNSRPKFLSTPSTVPLIHVCGEIALKVDEFLRYEPDNEDEATAAVRKSTKQHTRESLKVIGDALRRYTNDELSISFNGGKDCLVMLMLLLASMHYHKGEFAPQRIHTIYIHSEHAFPEVDKFVNECVSAYWLDLIRLPSPMKQAFQQFLDAKPHVKAIMVGTRRTDPNGKYLTYFDETDHGWPKFMRVHPVIDWHYADVWLFLRAIQVPYCILYDMGYTSLGGVTDTFRNPALASGEEGDHKTFRPAYSLLDDDMERLGRSK